MQGTVVEGVIDAADEKTAVERLRNSGIIPLKVSSSGAGLKKKIALRASKTDLLTFTTELSALLTAGLPLDRSLNILAEISDNKDTKGVIQSILKSIREGSSFSEALLHHPKIFPRIYVNMVRAGEAGGVLDAVLDKLNEFLESSKELKDQVFSAMIYPAILVLVGTTSIVLLLAFVLPRFSVIFADIGKAMPLPMRILLTLSNSMRSFWWLFFLAVIVLWLLFRSYVRSGQGRRQWDAVKLRLLSDVIRKLETARFCRTLGTLLKSGVPLLQALHNSKDVISNQVIASAIDAVSKGAKEGRGIADPLVAARVLPPLALSMIKVGEETGQLDDMLLKVASTYEKSLKTAIKRFVSFLEPAMILGMALVIGFIVISMLLSIFSITELPF